VESSTTTSRSPSNHVLTVGKDISYAAILAHGGIPHELIASDTIVQFAAPSRAESETNALVGWTLSKYQLVPRAQWMLGFKRALRLCGVDGDDLVAMFDKLESRCRFERAGVPVPALLLGHIDSFDELPRGRMFLKPVFGSSAAGIVALQIGRRRAQAWTTVDVQDGILFNSRRVRTINSTLEIARLVERLCNYDQMFVEQWVPKASIDGKAFDVRVVVRDGVIEKRVARLSRTPMTNLHLLNERRDAPFGAAADATCLRAMQCFPTARSAGIDLAFTPRYKSHVVFEINAFGTIIHDSA